MRFQVPQFIEVESKIFGPLTLKQFIYLAGGAGMIFLIYISLPFFFAILLGAPIAAFSIALAFLKINNQPFVKIIESALRYFSKPRVYIWKKTEKKTGRSLSSEQKAPEMASEQQTYIPKLTRSRLKELAWSLDIKEEIK